MSDRGPQFILRVWKAFFSLLGVTVSLTSGYHPQSNGQTERKIQEVGRFLRTFCHGHQNSWNQFLGWAEYTQNSLRQISTGDLPAPRGWDRPPRCRGRPSGTGRGEGGSVTDRSGSQLSQSHRSLSPEF